MKAPRNQWHRADVSRMLKLCSTSPGLCRTNQQSCFGGLLPEAFVLSDFRDEPLARSPLTLVVCQIRHNRLLSATEVTNVLKLKDRLQRYPEVIEEAEHQVALGGGPGGLFASAPQSIPAWKLQSEDGNWRVAIRPDFFALETTAYESWTDFTVRLTDLIDGIIEVFRPSLEQRLGLRFIDEITDPIVASPSDWRPWIRAELLGVVTDDLLGRSVRSCQQLVELQGPGSLRVNLRHGIQSQPDGRSYIYLIDQDCFRAEGREFKRDDILAAAEELHRLALGVFQSAITPELYDYLKSPT